MLEALYGVLNYMSSIKVMHCKVLGNDKSFKFPYNFYVPTIIIKVLFQRLNFNLN